MASSDLGLYRSIHFKRYDPDNFRVFSFDRSDELLVHEHRAKNKKQLEPPPQRKNLSIVQLSAHRLFLNVDRVAE